MDGSRKKYRYPTPRTINVGVVGTGYVGEHFVAAFDGYQGIKVSGILSRRRANELDFFARQDLLVSSIEELLEYCDVVFECTGDPVYAADIVAASFRAARPVVTMNSEFQVTAGSYFSDKGLLTEAEGDQPGSLAALHERVVEMGFRPLAYCNMKAFLNHNPTLEEMLYWAEKKSISLDKVISFTDGTKLQIEQALVANGLKATIGIPGMHGLEGSNLDNAANFFGEKAKSQGCRLSDYIIYPNAPHGVFIVAEHDKSQHGFLDHIKMGTGPFYILTQNDVLVHLQVPKTIRNIANNGKVLLNNSPMPSINVVSIAKRQLKRGDKLTRGIGSFDVRGEARKIIDLPDAIPIGLLQHVTMKRQVDIGDIICFDDVELNDTLALKAWRATLERVVNRDAITTSN